MLLFVSSWFLSAWFILVFVCFSIFFSGRCVSKVLSGLHIRRQSPGSAPAIAKRRLQDGRGYIKPHPHPLRVFAGKRCPHCAAYIHFIRAGMWTCDPALYTRINVRDIPSLLITQSRTGWRLRWLRCPANTVLVVYILTCGYPPPPKVTVGLGVRRLVILCKLNVCSW